MSDLSVTPLKHAETLRKEGKFAEALQVYNDCWTVACLFATEWDFWGYAFCLNKLKRHAEALDFCREAYPKFPKFAALNNVYAWAIYHEAIACEKPLDEAAFLKAAKSIVRLCPNLDDVYSPLVTTVFKVLDRLTAKKTFPTALVLEWTAVLNGEKLDDTPFSFTDAKGRACELASKREQFYALRTKALLLNQEYEECIELVNVAFEQVSNFHYGNELWLRRNAALAQEGLGANEQAFETLQQLWAKRKEWFLALDLAGLAVKCGHGAVALVWALKGAMAFGDAEKKVKLFKLMAKVLMQEGRVALALQHYELVALLREEQGWSEDMAVTYTLVEHQVTVGALGSSAVLLPLLQKEWALLVAETTPRLVGTISKLLPHGKAGFVKAADGKSYYFQVSSFKGKRTDLVENAAVSFVLEEGFDKVKQREMMNAVGVQVVKS